VQFFLPHSVDKLTLINITKETANRCWCEWTTLHFLKAKCHYTVSKTCTVQVPLLYSITDTNLIKVELEMREL